MTKGRSRGRERPLSAIEFSMAGRMPAPRLVLSGVDVDAAAFLIEADDAIDEGKQRPILAGANIQAGAEFAAALPDDNRARGDFLAAETFDSPHLRVGIPTVAGRALTFLMCHFPRLRASGTPRRAFPTDRQNLEVYR